MKTAITSERVVAEPAKRVNKNQRTFIHDLFKLQVAQMMKNLSWRFKDPQIVHVEHVHFYHSIDEKTGRHNEYCSYTGGHTHKVEVDWSRTTKKTVTGPDGRKSEIDQPVVTVGPPLKSEVIRTASGRDVRKLLPIEFENDGVDANEKPIGNYVDRHVHEIEYLGSEEFTTEGRNDFRKAQRDAVKGLVQGPASTQPAAFSKMEEGAARGAEIAAGKGTGAAGTNQPAA